MDSHSGFLSVMKSADVGRAVFDVSSGLWMPGLTEAVTLSGNVEEQLEVNALATAFATAMADRLSGRRGLSDAMAIREVTYRLTGTVGDTALATEAQLRAAKTTHALELPDKGIGYFRPAPVRLVVTSTFHGNMAAYISAEASRMVSRISTGDQTIDCYAPVGRDLRPGEAFDDQMMIGLGADPESGLRVRVLRFDHDAFGPKTRRTMFELAGGTWCRFPAGGHRPTKIGDGRRLISDGTEPLTLRDVWTRARDSGPEDCRPEDK